MKKLTVLAIAIVIITCGTQKLFAQEAQQKIADFDIIVQKIDDGFKFSCDKGCAWKTLSYTNKWKGKQKIDTYGMHSMANGNPNHDFLFEIQKTKKGFKLVGLKGTSWTNLEIFASDNIKYRINQSGINKLDE